MSLPLDKCPYCGAEREFSWYAAAHWDIPLTATCEDKDCRKQYETIRGRSLKLRQSKNEQ